MPPPPAASLHPPAWRTTAAILLGMLVPVGALAVMAWLSTSMTARQGSTVTRAGSSGAPAAVDRVKKMKVQVVASYPHDTSAFTQGLHYEGKGILYESTGLEGQSTLRRVDLATGRVLQSLALAPDLFGEGLARTPRALIQLTYRDQMAFIYDPASLKVVGQFSYEGEGWGLCYDGTSLVMSDGSDTLTFRRPIDFTVERSIPVRYNTTAVHDVNELECVNGSVYANVWRRQYILRIDPASGAVTELIDVGRLLNESEAKEVDVLNGIAYDPGDDTFYLTGKRWPKLFKVRFVPDAT